MRRHTRNTKPKSTQITTCTTDGNPSVTGLLELDRFSELSVERWSELAADLDELQDVLYFNLEPERRRHRPDLIKALQKTSSIPLELKNWTRIVDYRWSLHPLSAAGSLTGVGGRFNAGVDIDSGTLQPWPSLYLASDQATAFREKFQMAADKKIAGLTAEELSLCNGHSYTTIFIQGKLSKVFSLTPATLNPIARILGKIKMPDRAVQIRKKLKVNPGNLRMLTTGKQLHDVSAVQNWRVLPIQFGLPSQSQILSELIRAAGFEAILYQSSKSGGQCLAVFVDQITSESFIEISSQTPDGTIKRLDQNSADELAGWAALGLKQPSS